MTFKTKLIRLSDLYSLLHSITTNLFDFYNLFMIIYLYLYDY